MSKNKSSIINIVYICFYILAFYSYSNFYIYYFQQENEYIKI